MLLSEIGPTPYLLEVSTRRGIPDTLRDTSAFLQEAYRGLDKFFESKRHESPRLYLLTDSQLIHFLKVARDAELVDGMVGRCFPGVGRLGRVAAGAEGDEEVCGKK